MQHQPAFVDAASSALNVVQRLPCTSTALCVYRIIVRLSHDSSAWPHWPATHLRRNPAFMSSAARRPFPPPAALHQTLPPAVPPQPQRHPASTLDSLHRRPQLHDLARPRSDRHPGLHPAESADDHLAASASTPASPAPPSAAASTRLPSSASPAPRTAQRYSLRPRMLYPLAHLHHLQSPSPPPPSPSSSACPPDLPRVLLRRHARRRRHRLHRPHHRAQPRHGRRPAHRLAPARLLHQHGPRPARLPARRAARAATSPASTSLPHTTRTITSVEKLRAALRNVRRTGYALVDQELEVGLRSLAVPVYAPSGRVVATVNLAGTPHACLSSTCRRTSSLHSAMPQPSSARSCARAGRGRQSLRAVRDSPEPPG